MGEQLLGMMSCAGNGCEIENSDFYGKRSKIGLKIYGKRSKFERRNIKKHRGDGPRCFFVGMECCAEEMVRRGDVVPLRSGGGLAFQDFEGGAGGGAEHVDAGSQTFERFCSLDSGAERDAINGEYIDDSLAVDGHNLQAALDVVD